MRISARKTQELLAGQGKEARLRRGLAEDLNRLLERELKIKEQLKAKKQEKDAVDQEIADGSTSERLRKKQDQLAAEIAELSKTGSLYEPERFKQVQLSEYLTDFIKENPQSWTRIRLNRLLLEEAYPKEIARSRGGVYPDREIYSATPDDSQRCFQEYMADAQRRMQAGQLKPGEDVKIIDNRVQVSGQVAVMNINGLLTKVIFDHNPKNEFFVEESFPLDWMYPHLTPFGIIMKINRQPLPSLTEDILNRDHQFWKQFSKRLTGDIVDYDTPVKEIAIGSRRPTCATISTASPATASSSTTTTPRSPSPSCAVPSAAFTPGASAPQCPAGVSPQIRRRVSTAAQGSRFHVPPGLRLLPLQPGSSLPLRPTAAATPAVRRCHARGRNLPEAGPVQRPGAGPPGKRARATRSRPLVSNRPRATFQHLEDEVRKNPENFQAAFDLAGAYLQMQQTDRVVQVLEGVLNNPKADATAFRGLLQAYASFTNRTGLQKTVEKLEAVVRANPANYQAAIGLAEGYRHLQKNEAALQTLDKVFNDPKLDANAVLSIAQAYAGLGNVAKLEATLEKLTKVMPESPEAWYDLAVLKSGLGKPPEALAALRRSLELSAKRLQGDPKARDLLVSAKKEERFGPIRQLPEFQKLVP